MRSATILLLLCPLLEGQTAPSSALTTSQPAANSQPASTSATPAAATSTSTSTPTSVDVPADKAWTDTGIDLRRGDSIVLTADGTVVLPPQGKNAQSKSVGPEGQPRGFRDLVKTYPLNTSGFGALIGRIGSSDAAEPFLVGPRKEMQVLRAGRLFLGPNASSNDSITGTFHVTVAFTARGSETQTPPTDLKLPEVT